MKVVIEWFRLWSACKEAKMTKERNNDVRVCRKKGFCHCTPENCPLLEGV
jgi:hypothetical protein